MYTDFAFDFVSHSIIAKDEATFRETYSFQRAILQRPL